LCGGVWPAGAPYGKEHTLHWVVRWTDEQTDRDMAAVLEAPTRGEAEAAARELGIPYIFVARASQSDLADAARGWPSRERQWRNAPADAPGRYTCLGRPLGHAQLVALMLCGVATAMLHLRPILPAVAS
jgi:hypothetical protein